MKTPLINRKFPKSIISRLLIFSIYIVFSILLFNEKSPINIEGFLRSFATDLSEIPVGQYTIFDFDITCINRSNFGIDETNEGAVLVHGTGTVGDIANNDYWFWDAYVVEKNANDEYVITAKYVDPVTATEVADRTSKRSIQIPDDGFVLCFWADYANHPTLKYHSIKKKMQIGSIVEIDFDYSTYGKTVNNTTPFGKISVVKKIAPVDGTIISVGTYNSLYKRNVGTLVVFDDGKIASPKTANKVVGGHKMEERIAFRCEPDGNGGYRVIEIVTDTSLNKSLLVIPDNGIILYHGTEDPNFDDTVGRITLGSIITLDGVDVTTPKAVDVNGLGTYHVEVAFDPMGPEEKVERNNNLQPINNPTSTTDFIRVNLYDYVYIDENNNINAKWETDKKYPGFQRQDMYGKWTGGKYSFGFESNLVEDYDCGNGAVTSTDAEGTINETYGGANQPISMKPGQSVMNINLGDDGFPALSDGTSLGYLFGGESLSYVVKQNTANIDGLFQYDHDSEKFYFYSKETNAQFNSQTNRFDLYDEVLTPNFSQYPFGNFLPFNDIQKAKKVSNIDEDYFIEAFRSCRFKAEEATTGSWAERYTTQANKLKEFIDSTGYDKTAVNILNDYFKKSLGVDGMFTNRQDELETMYNIDFDDSCDFYFGMSIELNFVQSENGWCEADDTPREFFFNGDDDVWVYVDGVLFMDLSGIHREVGGKIDFNAGKVYYYGYDPSILGADLETPIKVVNFSDLVDPSTLNMNGTFEDGSDHSISFFYMERGSGSGVCKIEFNLERNHFHGEKIWGGLENTVMPESITVDLYRDGELYQTAVANEETNWKYDFWNIPIFNLEGTKYEYTIEEHALEDYYTEYFRRGDHDIDVKNTFMFKDVYVTKVWDDLDSEDRPESISISLSAKVGDNDYDIPDGIPTEVELNEDNDWEYQWEDLDRYTEDYDEISYFIEEIDPPEGYDSKLEISGRDYTITNTKYRDIKINKVDHQNSTVKLAGAEFKLEKLVEDDGEWIVDEDFTERTGVTGDDGVLVFDNLLFGKYRVTETKAPEDYRLLLNPIEIDVDSTQLEFELTIQNIKKPTLPFTGSIGIGCVIAISATMIVVSIILRKNEKRK